MSSEGRRESNNRSRFHRTVVLTAETTAVISFLSVIASIISSYIKFSRLGINVWDVSSFDDILVGSIDTFVLFVQIIPVIAIPCLIFWYLSYRFYPIISSEKILNVTRGASVFLLIIQISSVIVRLYPELIFGDLDQVKLHIPSRIKEYSTYIFILSSIIVISLCVSSFTNKWRYASIIILASLTSILIITSARQGERSLVYMAAYNEDLFEKVPNCYPSTVWVGSISVLVSCRGGNSRPYVVLNRSEVILMDYELFECTKHGRKVTFEDGVAPPNRCNK